MELIKLKPAPKTILWIIVLILASILFVVYNLIGKSFLNYSSKTCESYPNTLDTSKKFSKEFNPIKDSINNHLGLALLDTAIIGDLQILKNPKLIFLKYPRIFNATDTSIFDYYSQVRLCKFEAHGNNEKYFYENSKFKKLIELQCKNMHSEYFKIKFNATKTKIESIKVDEDRLYTSLYSDVWKGVVHFADPTINTDTSRIFCLYNNAIAPLFSKQVNQTLRQFTSLADSNLIENILLAMKDSSGCTDPYFTINKTNNIIALRFQNGARPIGSSNRDTLLQFNFNVNAFMDTSINFIDSTSLYQYINRLCARF
jgi:hypothetical protein